MHSRLSERDPVCAERIHPNDGSRIVRALEVYIQTGIPLSKWQQKHQFKISRYPSKIIGITRPVEELNSRINERVNLMMANGFLEEVRDLLNRGYSSKLKSMQSLGYRHLCDYIENSGSSGKKIDEVIEKIKTDTRKFSKRQRTWFRKEKEIEWVSPDADTLLKMADEFFCK
jgi:tRNA dimethylallyltransferase